MGSNSEQSVLLIGEGRSGRTEPQAAGPCLKGWPPLDTSLPRNTGKVWNKVSGFQWSYTLELALQVLGKEEEKLVLTM